MIDDDDGQEMSNVIRIDETRIKDHLGEMVRGTVEEALNAMLDAEADRLCGAGRYERSEGRQDTRAGSYERSLHTKAGEVKLKMPKLRRQTFETAIIERYQRRECSVEEALMEMYLAGVSVRRVEDITEALWGTRVSPGTVSNLNKKSEGLSATGSSEQPERQDPGMAEPTDRGRASLSLLGRHRHEAVSHLKAPLVRAQWRTGRRSPERLPACGQRG